MHPDEVNALELLRQAFGAREGRDIYELLEQYAHDVVRRHRCGSLVRHIPAIVFDAPGGHFHALHDDARTPPEAA